MLKHYYDGTLLTNAVLLGDEKGISAHATVGAADTSTAYVDDPTAIYDFVAYKTWKMVEDECPSGNQVVWHGYVGDQGITRVAGEGRYQTGVERRWRIELIEDNAWPSRQIIIAASADRPEETVSDRIAWVLTMRGMTGIIYDHGLVEACTTLMDPEDYRNRSAKAVLDDCSTLTNYNWHVRYREASDDIELIFQAPTSTADPAILSISNVADDIDETTTWAPNDEAEQKFGAGRLASGILLPYAGGTDYDQDPATAVTFGTVDQTAPTSAVKTKTKARAQIARLLVQHSEQDMSVEGLRLQLPAANLNDVKHGQLISSVRLSHGRGDITTGIPMRVKSKAFGRPDNLSQAVYDVDLSLSPVPGYCNAVDLLGNAITNTTDGFHPANFSATSRVDGLIQYANAGSDPRVLPDPYHVGEWYFPTYNVGPGSYDVMGDGVGNFFRVFVLGPGTVVINLGVNAARNDSALKWWDGFSEQTIESRTDQANGDIAYVVPDDGHCVHWVDVYDHGGTSGIGFALYGFTWTNA